MIVICLAVRFMSNTLECNVFPYGRTSSFRVLASSKLQLGILWRCEEITCWQFCNCPVLVILVKCACLQIRVFELEN